MQPFYDLHVPVYENYVAEGVVNHNTSKSNALVDRLGLAAMQYPGAQILFARNTLSDLKRSSLMRLKQRWGALFESENNVEAVYKFPRMPCPKTGEMRQSEIVCIGLDRNNLEDVMKSREFFRVGLEEGNGMNEQVHDFTLTRCRQDVWHTELKQKDWLLKRYRAWGVTWQEALDLLGWGPAELAEPMKGLIGVATVFNPEPNDPIWKRYVGVSHPDGGAVTPEWAAKHIGVRRKLITAESLRARGYTYQTGDMVEDPYGNVSYVLSDDKVTNRVKLVKPIKLQLDTKEGKQEVEMQDVPKGVLSLVVERNAIYAWQWENESGNKDNTKASFLVEDKELAEKYFEGKFKSKAGRIFPMFEREIHVLPTPRDLLERIRRLRGIAGIDQGGGHATAAVFYAVSRQGALLAFSEYTATDESASTTAYNLRMIPPYGMQVAWLCDPAMRAVQYATKDLASAMDRYIEAGIPLQAAPESGEKAIDSLRAMLEVKEQFTGTAPASSLYLFDCCEETINMFETIEWKDVITKRYKTIVDILDAAKFGATGRRLHTRQNEVIQQAPLSSEFVKTHFQQEGLAGEQVREGYDAGRYQVMDSQYSKPLLNQQPGSLFTQDGNAATVDFAQMRKLYGN